MAESVPSHEDSDPWPGAAGVEAARNARGRRWQVPAEAQPLGWAGRSLVRQSRVTQAGP